LPGAARFRAALSYTARNRYNLVMASPKPAKPAKPAPSALRRRAQRAGAVVTAIGDVRDVRGMESTLCASAASPLSAPE